MRAWVRERIYGSTDGRRRRPKPPRKPAWMPLTRESVAHLVAGNARHCDNPAARAAYAWAEKVILASGDPAENILFPKDYL